MTSKINTSKHHKAFSPQGWILKTCAQALAKPVMNPAQPRRQACFDIKP
jgi:hypothetical protein